MLLILLNIAALLLSVIFHEVAHGLVALKLGDDTAYREGRLTLNPIPHIDPIGSIVLPAFFLLAGAPFLIGWAKPVPVRSEYFRNPIRDMMWVAAAGPLTNIILAFLSSLALKWLLTVPMLFLNAQALLPLFLKQLILINLVLAVFNLFPIPPLDGSKIVLNFLPYRLQSQFLRLEPFGFVIILALLYFGILEKLLYFFLIPLLRVFLP